MEYIILNNSITINGVPKGDFVTITQQIGNSVIAQLGNSLMDLHHIEVSGDVTQGVNEYFTALNDKEIK